MGRGNYGAISTLLAKRRNNFDLLRFVAASLVIVSHSFALLAFEQPKAGGMTIGSLGVNIFFIMSGFLVSKSWDEHPRASAFIAKRLLRIIPGLAGVTLFGAFILGPLFTTVPLAVYFSDPLTYRYLQNILLFSLQYTLPNVFWHDVTSNIINGSIWTLPLEFLAYLGVLVAAAAGLFRRRAGFVLLVAFILVVASALIFVIKDPEKTIAGIRVLWLVKYGAFFMMGSAYYIYRDRILMTDRRALLAFLVLVFTASLPGQYVVMLLALPYLVFFLAFVPNRLAANFGRWGDFSYGMYIYAWPIQQAIIAWSHRDIGVLRLFALEFPIILVLAVLSWHVIEKPALKLKYRFNRDRYPVLTPAASLQLLQRD